MNTNTILQVVAKQAEKPLATKSELDELKRLQAEWQKATDAVNGCNIVAAYDAFLSEGKAAVKAAREGQLHAVPSHTREELERQFLARGEHARELQRHVHRESVPVATKVATRFCELANRVAQEEEKREAENFARFQQPYTPSALILALRRLSDAARVRTGDYSTLSPQQMLPFLSL